MTAAASELSRCKQKGRKAPFAPNNDAASLQTGSVPLQMKDQQLWRAQRLLPPSWNVLCALRQPSQSRIFLSASAAERAQGEVHRVLEPVPSAPRLPGI
mmetsp:Transcript_1084/g.2116  ORF Transcript_1084/g.2116 Transcript_1084/m.2116 type:complete len:99 (-) Transcript_1084:38-334(-)